MPITEVMGMDGGELSLWAAFLYGEHDIENRRMDERNAMLCAVSWNSNGARPQKSVSDFMPRRQVNDVKTMQAMLLAWAKGQS